MHIRRRMCVSQCLKLWVRYFVPSVHRRQELREQADTDDGPLLWWISVDENGKVMWWLQPERQLRRIQQWPLLDAFSVLIDNEVGLKLEWQAEWPAPPSCKPLNGVRLLSYETYASIYEDEKATVLHLLAGEAFRWTELRWFDLFVEYQYGTWPECTRAPPILRARIIFQAPAQVPDAFDGAEATTPDSDGVTVCSSQGPRPMSFPKRAFGEHGRATFLACTLTHAKHPHSGTGYGYRSRRDDKCSDCMDARAKQRFATVSKLGGSATAMEFGCDALLLHQANCAQPHTKTQVNTTALGLRCATDSQRGCVCRDPRIYDHGQPQRGRWLLASGGTLSFNAARR